MSHNSTVETNLKVKADKKGELKRTLKRIKDKPIESLRSWERFNLLGLTIGKDQYLEFLPDNYGDFRFTDAFAYFLKDYVESGELSYVGEDGERWGYEFDGNGNVYHLRFTQERGEKLKDEIRKVDKLWRQK